MKHLFELADRKITIIAGHFGTGKTNIAVNLALDIAGSGTKCRIADLDIVNPYFRSADNTEILEAAGAEALIPEFANTNVDIPALPENYYSMFTGEGKSVADVGGDGDGAAVLGISRDEYIACGYRMYFVCNKYRPYIATPEGALACLRDIERVSGLKFSGIINNSNLGSETTAETVVSSADYANALAAAASVPLVMTTARRDICVPGSVPIDDITKKLF